MILAACKDYRVLASVGLLKRWRNAVLAPAEAQKKEVEATEAQKAEKEREAEILRERRLQMLSALMALVEDAEYTYED